MKKKLLYFTAIASIILFAACNNEDVLPKVERTFSLTATMPDEDPSTRVALAPDGKNVDLTWTTDDIIDLVYVKTGQTMKRQRAQVTSVTNNGKIAHFDINIPASFTGSFDLYGVHGGRGTDPNEATRNHALLPINPGEGIPADLMLYFKHEMEATDTQASVTFQHLGSIFSITLRNNSGSTYTRDFNEFRLVGVNNVGNTNWAYNNGVGGQIFDLTAGAAGEFLNQESAGNYISFSTNFNNLNNGENTIAWGWYPTLPGKIWPALQLELIDGNGSFVQQSVNIKPEKTSAPILGMAYHFYAVWDGTNLNFTDASFDVNP